MPTEPATDTYVNRIQALLTKAESTTFPEEAEALLAKAQQLMARHAIDEAMLAAASGRGPGAVIDRRVTIAAPYASAKASLLNAVVRANRCRMVVGRGPSGTQYCTVVGHEADLADVDALFSALSVQAVRFMLQAEVPPHDGPRRFRHAFLLAFAARIGERLAAAQRDAVAEAEEAARADRLRSGDAPSVGLVLASREAEVDAAFRKAFPRVTTRSVSLSSGAGYQSGRAAADRAALSHRGVGGSRGSLPSG